MGSVLKLGLAGEAAYRCSLLDASENVQSVHPLDARDDTEAMIQAIALLGGADALSVRGSMVGARIVARVPKTDSQLSQQLR